MIKIHILILYTSVGHGMKITAFNIADKLNKSGKYEVRLEDVGEVTGKITTKISTAIYRFIFEKLSPLWGFLYSSKVVERIVLPLRWPIAKAKSKKILEILREFQPAMVISTQVSGTGIVAYLKSQGLYIGKLAAAFSDYHLHRFWLFKEVDLYLCNIPEQADELKRMGFEQKKLAVTGMLLNEKFFKPISREQACQQFGLLTTMPVVLVTNGALARMETKEIFLRLLRSPKSFQIVVATGKSQKLKNELEKISPPSNHPVKILGWIENMDVLMSAAVVLIGKTGGPTMAEAVVKKLPIILTQVLPGHETINLNYLLEHKLADFARNSREAAFMAEQILEGKLNRDWQRAYEKIVRPKNAVDLLQALERIAPIQTQGIEVNHYY